MSVEQQSRDDSSNDSQIVERFCDEFNAVEGYDLEMSCFSQPDIWVGEESIVMLSPTENDSIGYIDLTDMVVAEETYVGRVREDDTPVCVAKKGGYEHAIHMKYLNWIANVFGEQLSDVRMWVKEDALSFPIIVEFTNSNSEYIAVIAPRRVSKLTGVDKSHDL